MGVARGDAASVTDMLPDLDQSPPYAGDMQIVKEGDRWAFAFGSEFYNRGPGQMIVYGARADASVPAMTITQTLQRSDGSTRDRPVDGQMIYTAGNHNHWHVVNLERYELRSLANPKRLAPDHKQGFCMTELSPDSCGKEDPGRLRVDEGVGVSTAKENGFDYYLPNVEGQSVYIDPLSTPSGLYSLNHFVNPTRMLSERSYANNTASAEIQLNWGADGIPTFKFIAACPDSINCGAPRMSAAQAKALSARALKKAAKAKGAKTKCKRRALARFVCTSSWTRSGRKWSGRTEVWFQLVGTKQVGLYNLDAKSGNKKLRKRAARV